MAMSSRFLRRTFTSILPLYHRHHHNSNFQPVTACHSSQFSTDHSQVAPANAESVSKLRTLWDTFLLKTKLLPSANGSVLEIHLRGEISDQLPNYFSTALSLPQLCDRFEKAAYDPRVLGIYLHIETLICGWGKLDEIQRCILEFKKSGKFVVGYAPICGMKEYYIGCVCDELYVPPSGYVGLYGILVNASFYGGALEKAGIEPQVERIGKYKSAGDQLTRKNMSDENREMLTALLDNIYSNWVDKVSLAKGKKKVEVENLINEGVYKVKTLKEEGWITEVKYHDEVISMLRTRLGVEKHKTLPVIAYKKYNGARKWTLGLKGSEDQIAVIRASGIIRRTQGSISTDNSQIIAEKFIEKIQNARGWCKSFQ